MPRVFTKLRCTVGNGVFAVLGALSLCILVLWPGVWRRSFERYAHWHKRFAFWVLRMLSGFRFKVEGLENWPKDRPVLLVMNHQSMLDTLFLLTLRTPPPYAIARLQAKFPLLNWYGKKWMVMVPEQRGNVAELRQSNLTEECKKLTDLGRSIYLFPEGSMCKPLEGKKFSAGVFLLAKALQVPVVPIAHNFGVFWPRWSLKHPGTATVKFFPPIDPPSAQTVRSEWMASLQTLIQREADALVTQAWQAYPSTCPEPHDVEQSVC